MNREQMLYCIEKIQDNLEGISEMVIYSDELMKYINNSLDVLSDLKVQIKDEYSEYEIRISINKLNLD